MKNNLFFICLIIIALLVGYGIGSSTTLLFCAKIGLNILDKMQISVNVPQSEVLTKIVQHLNLLQ